MKCYKRIVGFAITIVFVVVLIAKADISQILETIKMANPYVYTLLFLLQIITLSMSAFLWFYPLKKIKESISFLNIFRINSASGFVESITPSSKLGGEAARIVLLKNYTALSKTDLAAHTVLNKLVTFLPFMAVSAVLVGSATTYFNIPYAVIFSLAGLVLFFLGLIVASAKIKAIGFVKDTKVSKILAKTQEVINISNKIVSAKEFFLLNGVSLAVWGLYPVKMFIVSEMFAMDIPFILVAVSLFCAYCVSILPITPGGLGTFEATLVLILSLNGVNFQDGLLLAIASRLVTYWLPLLVSIISWLTIIANFGKLDLFRGKREVNGDTITIKT